MLTETGQVVSLKGQYALIDVKRTSGCQSCSLKTGCGTSVLSRFFSQRFSHVKALNNLQVSEGDVVEIELDETSLLYMTFWAYLFPISFMLAAMAFVTWLTDSTGYVAVFGVVGLLVGIYFSRRYVTGRLKARQLYPVISKVVKSKI